MPTTRFLPAAAAAELIQDGDTVAISGNGAGMISLKWAAMILRSMRR